MNGDPFWLLAGLLIAHYVGDFTPLATQGMQRAKANGGPLSLIAGHASVHTLLVTGVFAVFLGPAWLTLAVVAAIEFLSHFAIDAGRSRLGQRLPTLNDPRRSPFWYALGVDQLAHGLVLVGLAALATSGM